MGLDMYLNAKRYLWMSETEIADDISRHFPELKGRKVQEVKVEAVYWRKCNAIHRWFVENVQGGVDNCESYYVSREHLQELYDLIQEVLASKDSSKLPPQAGFFFGSTDVDEYYWKDLEYSAEKIQAAIEDFPSAWDFEYRASW